MCRWRIRAWRSRMTPKHGRRTPRDERRTYRGKLGAADRTSDRASHAARLRADRPWHNDGHLLLLSLSDLELPVLSIAPCRSERDRQDAESAGSLLDGDESQRLGRLLPQLSDHRHAGLAVRGARPLSERAIGAAALPDRDALPVLPWGGARLFHGDPARAGFPDLLRREHGAGRRHDQEREPVFRICRLHQGDAAGFWREF